MVLRLTDPELVHVVQLVPVAVHPIHVASRAHPASLARATLVICSASLHNYLMGP